MSPTPRTQSTSSGMATSTQKTTLEPVLGTSKRLWIPLWTALHLQLENIEYGHHSSAILTTRSNAVCLGFPMHLTPRQHCTCCRYSSSATHCHLRSRIQAIGYNNSNFVWCSMKCKVRYLCWIYKRDRWDIYNVQQPRLCHSLLLFTRAHYTNILISL